jgi:endoglucanase
VNAFSLRPIGVAVALTLATAGLTAPAVHAQEAPELVHNGGFDAGLESWFDTSGTASFTTGELCIVVPGGTANPWDVIVGQNDIDLQLDESYVLSFDARASKDVTVRALVGNSNPNFETLTDQNPGLTTSTQHFSYPFTAWEDLPTGQVAFQVGGKSVDPWTFCVDNVSLVGGQPPPVYTPDTGPRVRVNQVGYLPRGPKSATLVTEATEPLPWELKDASGAVVASGTTSPAGVDPSAGLNVHTIDFTAYAQPGADYTLVADGEISYPFDISTEAFEQLRKDTKTFFYTNRSGTPISDAIAPGYGRAAGHVGVAPNRGDTAVPCQALDDDSQKLLVKQGDQPWTCDYLSDVSGGWYDAGDHGKYVVNGGIAVAQLMQEYERTKNAASVDVGRLGDSTLRVPETGNAVPDLLDEARWELDWMLKMQVRPGRQLAGMAFHKVADVDWTGLPLAPANDPQKRVLYRPSTAATLNLAAAAAQGARLFASYDSGYARRLLAAARTAYAAAVANPALFAPVPDGALDPNPGSGPYDDHVVTDEFYWAAAELYLTTGESAYRNAVLSSPWNSSPDAFTAGGFDWGHVAALGRLDLATVPNELPARSAIRQSVLAAADTYLADQAGAPFGQAYAPENGNYVWGSNSQILNNMQVIGTAYDLSGALKYRNGVLGSLDYIFGRNALNQSYVTGYGDKFSENQHSRMYSHQLDASLPNPPAGTVAGGPNSTTASTGDPVSTPLFRNGCAAQFCYVDDIGSWSTNEITINWNAPMSWVASFVADQDDGSPPSPGGCRVSYQSLHSGVGIIAAKLKITNTSAQPLGSWVLDYAYTGAQRVVVAAVAGSVHQRGERVTIDGGSDRHRLAPGKSTTIAVIGTNPWGADWSPELFRINGGVCG